MPNFIVLCLLFLFSLTTQSAEVVAKQKPAQNVSQSSMLCDKVVGRPCIGLVLAGGGARGSAHVGTLKAIDELNIPIDLIVGTSIGSFVGGLYATGHSANEIEQMFLNTNWDSGYQDDQPRNLIPNRRKDRNDYFPIQLDIGLDLEGIKLPKGLIQGQGMKSIIDNMLGAYPEAKSFNDLGIPYRAVAANAATGEQVILDHGDLATAMQASMSLPGILRPISIDGRLLVDGGIANNLPVSVARAQGADIIIAVDIGSPSLPQEKLNSSLDILNQMTNFLTQSNQRAARASLTTKDIHIQPNLDEVTIVGFDQMQKGIDAGYKAAMQSFENLSYPNHHKNQQAKLEPVEGKIIDRIVLVNNSRLGDDYILERMQLSTGEAHSQQKIEQGIQRLYGQGTIARAASSITANNEIVLTITVDEKEWGPGYLDFKLSFEDDFKSFSLFEVGASWIYTNLNPYGASWSNEVEFGTKKRLSSELYWPIGVSKIYGYTQAESSREVSSYKQNSSSYGDIIVTQSTLGGGAGIEFSDQLDTRLGLEVVSGNIKLPAFLQSSLNKSRLSVDRRAVVARARYDSLDNAYFSTEGWRVDASFKNSQDRILNKEEVIQMLELDVSFAWSYGNHSIKPLLRKQATYAKNIEPLLGSYDLGGFLNLSGNERGFKSEPHVVFSRVVYAYELAENKIGAITLPLYLGASYERGNAWQSEGQVSWSNMISSGSVFLGWDSPIGPAFLAYGRSSTGKDSLYVSLGIGY